MIRDEFKNADKSVINKKANKKMQEMGERAYYAKKLSLYNEILKPIKGSSIFCSVCFFIVAALYILDVIVQKKASTPAIIIFCVSGALLIWDIIWFAYLAPKIRGKVELYKSELARLNREYINKTVKR